jgi:hypothetical protein
VSVRSGVWTGGCQWTWCVKHVITTVTCGEGKLKERRGEYGIYLIAVYMKFRIIAKKTFAKNNSGRGGTGPGGHWCIETEGRTFTH